MEMVEIGKIDTIKKGAFRIETHLSLWYITKKLWIVSITPILFRGLSLTYPVTLVS